MKYTLILQVTLSIMCFTVLCNVFYAQSDRPNILFIPVDDLRPDFSVYGNQMVITPNLDRLAKKGIVFERAYCQQAVCNPSRASLLTGLRPDTLQVWDLKTNMRSIHPDLVTLPQYFKQNGYTTIGLGKTFHNIFLDSLSWNKDIHIPGYPFDPDAMYTDTVNLNIIENKKQRFIENKNFKPIDKYGLWYIKANATECAEVSDETYFDAVQTTEAIKQLQLLKQGNQPFFLSVGYYKPHLPFNAPKKYWDMYDRNKIRLASNQFIPEGSPVYAVHGDQELRSYDDFRDLPLPDKGNLEEERQRILIHGYYACVSYIDAQIGRLLDELTKLGLEKNTIIVLWGDHGWKLGEHNSWAKQSNYEIDTRVPLIFACKGVDAKGARTNSLAELVDIFPTLCDMADLPLPSNLQGASLRPILRNPKNKVKEAAYSQFLLGRFPPRPDVPERMGYAVRTERYRYVEWYAWNDNMKGDFLDSELFDHSADPQENKNVQNEERNREIVGKLKGLLFKK
ncbi:MAG: sulfatase [Saprospiraceae bacterium]|jgi:arylsulfatase A-like enzyme|nr:sulfatase [Saprospiraceae bacterium]